MVKVSVAQLCLTLCDPWAVSHQPPLSMEFSRQECWSGWSFPSPVGLPDPGIDPWSPALQTDSSPSEPPGKTPNLLVEFIKTVFSPLGNMVFLAFRKFCFTCFPPISSVCSSVSSARCFSFLRVVTEKHSRNSPWFSLLLYMYFQSVGDLTLTDLNSQLHLPPITWLLLSSLASFPVFFLTSLFLSSRFLVGAWGLLGILRLLELCIFCSFYLEYLCLRHL